MRRWAVGGAVALAVAAGATSAAAGTPHDTPTVPPAPKVDLHLPAHPTQADLDRVTKLVQKLTKQAQDAATAVDRAADKEAYLGVALDQAKGQAQQAQDKLDEAVRQNYEQGGGSQVLGFLAGISPADTEAVRQAQNNQVKVDGTLVAASAQAGNQVAALQKQSDDLRASLLKQAGPVEAAANQAEAVLDQATQAFQADQAALAALAAQRAALEAASEQVAIDVTPAVTASGQAAAAAQAPVLALLEQTPTGSIPAGYHETGQVVRGISSWYGPGFVGSPTSSGSPYNPEQLTAAMLAVPLGTLVHVVTATGGQVNVLVTDHGPYAGVDRVIDLSERAATLAGVGLTPVTVEVLAPN